LNVTYEDGSTDAIVTDTSWQFTSSPVFENDIYDGEAYDARREKPGWAKPGFDDSDWKTAKESAPPSDDVKRRPQRTQPIEVTESLEPASMWTHNGAYVIDFGQNHAGWLELTIRGANEGDEITLEHAELITDNGDIDTANLRSAEATDTYIAKGNDVEMYEPRFTYHGYRYAKISGYPGDLSMEDVTAKAVHTGFKQTGSFACSNEELNQVQQNAVWGLRSNAHSIPTDCCQRNERMGWTGDGHLAVNSYLLNFDATRFQWKWMDDHDDNQSPEGTQSDTIPHAYGRRDADPNWAKTRVVNAWRIYQQTGDTRVLAERYEGMKAYVDYWDSVADEHVVPAGKNHYGDWLAFEPRNNDKALMNTFPHYQTTRRFAQIAEVVGNDADAETYHQRADAIASAFNDAFFDPDANQYGSGDQTSYALPLFMGVVPDGHEEAVAENLVSKIWCEDAGKLQTGFVGTRPLLFALVEHGYPEIAYHIVSQPEEPGWIHMVRYGATTMWERWDAEDHGPGLNSRNHTPWALISEWFYRELAGIEPAQPGYEHVEIAPLVPDSLDSAEGDIETIRGTVASSWERIETSGKSRTRDGLVLNVTIPDNATATVRIPTLGSDKVRVRESGKTIWNNGNHTRPNHPGVRNVKRDGERIVIDIGSGGYQLKLEQLGESKNKSATKGIQCPNETPQSAPWTWGNWENPSALLRSAEYNQSGQIHNPMPIRWNGDWYMYTIDGDFSGGWVNTDLWKRTADGKWELFENDVIENHEVNDVCVVDGTVIAYAGQTGITVWTGSNLTDLTKRGRVPVGDGGDPGCHYDPDTGKVHLYYESGDPPDTGFSGEYLGHSVSPNGVTDWSELEPVIDTTNTDYDVGDPRLVKVGPYYHLFVDWNRQAPLEQIAHYYGKNYSDFDRGEVIVAGSAVHPSSEEAIEGDRARAVGDGAPRYIDGKWKLFFEAGTPNGGEIWSAESSGPMQTNNYEVVTSRRYRPDNGSGSEGES
jgi:hypothetical protein